MPHFCRLLLLIRYRSNAIGSNAARRTEPAIKKRKSPGPERGISVQSSTALSCMSIMGFGTIRNILMARRPMTGLPARIGSLTDIGGFFETSDDDLGS
jgi:hypothetical protein